MVRTKFVLPYCQTQLRAFGRAVIAEWFEGACASAVIPKCPTSGACFACMSPAFCSKSDPMAVLYEERNGQWVEAGRTEVIANTHREQSAHSPIHVCYAYICLTANRRAREYYIMHRYIGPSWYSNPSC